MVNIREVIYFAARAWWFIAPCIVLVARIFGAPWIGASLLGLIGLLVILAAPGAFGVFVAVVSREMHRRMKAPR